jgi:hypothetical protein
MAGSDEDRELYHAGRFRELATKHDLRLTEQKGPPLLEIACGAAPCSRSQPFKPNGVRGGVTAAEAESIGWLKILVAGAATWRCPFCLTVDQKLAEKSRRAEVRAAEVRAAEQCQLEAETRREQESLTRSVAVFGGAVGDSSAAEGGIEVFKEAKSFDAVMTAKPKAQAKGESFNVLTDEEAEDAIWSAFWQFSQARDRRLTSPITELDPASREYVERKRSLDPDTGLPISANDLGSKALAISGVDLALAVMLPPDRLAASCVQHLDDSLPDTPENWQRYGKTLAHIPRTSWTEDQANAVRVTALKIKLASQRLGEKGWLNLRPIDAKDPDMHDLPWTDEAGFSSGFKLTYKGYEHLQQLVQKRPHLKATRHVLELVGHDVRAKAPQWAKAEYVEKFGSIH